MEHKEVIFANKKYILETNKDNKPVMKRYDEKNKINITFEFSSESKNVKKELIDILSKEFINKVTNS